MPAAFAEAIDAGYLRYVQPDVGKWGGIGCGLAVARRASAAGIAYCPHWLAGGVGLAASLHALAAGRSEGGYAEIDANPNPLREEVFPLAIEDGWVTLSDAPGLGVEPDLARLARYVVTTGSRRGSAGSARRCRLGRAPIESAAPVAACATGYVPNLPAW